MYYSYRIDWLTVVCDTSEAHLIGSHVARDLWIPTKGRNGYDIAYEDYVTGVVRLESSTRPDMGTCFVASSKAIDMITVAMQTDDQIAALEQYGFTRGKATRIDLCLDIHDNGRMAHAVADLARSGSIKTTARRMSVLQSLDNTSGVTTYFGSRESPRFGRVYDKNAESSGKLPYSRFELECKQQFAAWLWLNLGRATTPDALYSTVVGAWAGFVSSWGDVAVQFVFEGVQEILPPSRAERDSDTKDWLSRQVVPTLVESVQLEPLGENLMSWLVSEVKRRLQGNPPVTAVDTPSSGDRG